MHHARIILLSILAVLSCAGVWHKKRGLNKKRRSGSAAVSAIYGRRR